MEDFYTIIKTSPAGIDKMWHYKSGEKARSKFEKEAEKMKTALGYNDANEEAKETDWIIGRTIIAHFNKSGRYTVEIYKCQFKD